MERRQIEYFLAIIDYGSFTAASTARYVAQPSLSHSIRTLERDLGTDLFYRMPHGVRLTAAGEVFEVSARRIMREMTSARSSVQDVVGLLRGHLDVATLPTLAMDPLALAIGQFKQYHPDVTVRLIQPERSKSVLEAVRSGEAELGLVDLQPPESTRTELECLEIGSQELVLVMPPGTTNPPGDVSMKRLLRMNLITGMEGTLVRDHLMVSAYKLGLEPHITVEVGRRESAIHLVLAGAGSAVLPAPLAHLAATQGAVLCHLQPRFTRNILLIHRHDALSPAARRFKELLPGVGNS